MGLLDILGTNASSNSTFECPECGKRTPHSRITLTEWAAVNNSDDIIGRVSATFCDVFQIRRVANIAGITHWKCCNCGLTTIRKSDGTIDTIGEIGK